jgi:hypothetical protein
MKYHHTKPPSNNKLEMFAALLFGDLVCYRGCYKNLTGVKIIIKRFVERSHSCTMKYHYTIAPYNSTVMQLYHDIPP